MEHMQNALRTGAVSHAYILCGDQGSGKLQLARAFAAALQCSDPVRTHGLIEPCGKCHSCLQVIGDSHPDITLIRHQKKNESDRREALSVDDARRMRSDVQIKPYSDPWKIYIVPDADQMTAQAQNALLKTLEEPPAYAVILLLARGTENFLPTVLSRCITLRLRPVPESDLAAWLRNALPELTEPELLQLARLSQGNPGRAQLLSQDDELRLFIKETDGFLKDLAGKNSYEIAQFADGIVGEKKAGKTEKGTAAGLRSARADSTGKQKGKKVDTAEDAAGAQQDAMAQQESVPSWNRQDEFYGVVTDWYRDLLVAKAAPLSENLIFTGEVQYSRETGETLSFEACQRIQDALQLALRRRATGGNDSQILQMLLLEIRGILKNI